LSNIPQGADLYIIIDTSSILFGFSNRRDVFDIARRRFPGTEVLISAGILGELSKLAVNRGAKGAGAKTAIEALKYKKVDVDNSTGSVDSWIYAKSQEYPHSVVITNDTELYKKLKTSNIKCLKLTKAGLLR
jgi:rRNA-processing protein FCF1